MLEDIIDNMKFESYNDHEGIGACHLKMAAAPCHDKSASHY